MIDFTGFIAFAEKAKAEATAEVDRIAANALTAMRQAAQVEKQTHRYQNRSGTLERSTKGVLISAGKRLVRVQLEAGAHYAATVNRRGFMNIEPAFREGLRELQDRLDGMSRRVNARLR